MSTEKSHYQSSGRQKLRLFLEGREVPVISATVSATMGSAKMASIQLVPLQIIKFIRPRTQVHLFVRDSLTFGDDNFYLAFDGEVTGRSMSKRHDGRAVTITAIDTSGYLDDAKAFIMNPNFLAGKAVNGVLEGEPTPEQNAKANAAKVVSTNANQSSLMVDYLTRFKNNGEIDLVRGAMEVAKQLASVNEFYRTSYERLRVIDRLFIKGSGRFGKLLKSVKVEEYLSSYAGSIGGMTSIRQMLNDIMGLIFHEFISLPFPSLVSVEKDGKYLGKSIAEFLFVPDSFLLPPPRCNVIFPSQQIGFEFSEDFRAAPTRMGFRYSFPMVANDDASAVTYPIRYYPTPFADYMYGSARKPKSTSSELNSAFGPSKLIKGKDGQTYAQLKYGEKSKSGDKVKAVGHSYMPTLREADFLTNEESLKGIYYSSEILAPSYTALVRSGRVTDEIDKEEAVKESTSRDELMDEVGRYLFMKKRYGSRQVAANIMFNPFLVPGFSALFLDDSDAGQSFLAKIQGIQHTFTNEGFMTNVDLGYARDFDEVDLMTGAAGDPPLPSWFDPSIYGSVDESKEMFNKETNYLGPANSKVDGRGSGLGHISNEEVSERNERVTNPTIYPKLSEFYKSTIGCESVTFVGPERDKKKTQQVIVTSKGATQYLVGVYKDMDTQLARDAFVRNYTRRSIPTMEQAFEFLGAQVKGFQGKAGQSAIPEEFAKFVAITDSAKTGLPGRFDGSGYSDEIILKLRRDVVDKYVAQLKTKRGFRG